MVCYVNNIPYAYMFKSYRSEATPCDVKLPRYSRLRHDSSERGRALLRRQKCVAQVFAPRANTLRADGARAYRVSVSVPYNYIIKRDKLQ